MPNCEWATDSDEVESVCNSQCLKEKESATFLKRYFSLGFIPDAGNVPGNDLCILMHSNRVMIVTLAKSNIYLKKGIKEVDFQVTSNTNRLENKLRGKRKRGGQFLGVNSPLVRLVLESGEEVAVPAAIRGKLIEVNQRLVSNPKLLTSNTNTEGYLAIVSPKLTEHEDIVKSLMKEAEFEKLRTEQMVCDD